MAISVSYNHNLNNQHQVTGDTTQCNYTADNLGGSYDYTCASGQTEFTATHTWNISTTTAGGYVGACTVSPSSHTISDSGISCTSFYHFLEGSVGPVTLTFVEEITDCFDPTACNPYNGDGLCPAGVTCVNSGCVYENTVTCYLDTDGDDYWNEDFDYTACYATCSGYGASVGNSGWSSSPELGEETYGCTNISSCNYDSSATEDDGSCTGSPEFGESFCGGSNNQELINCNCYQTSWDGSCGSDGCNSDQRPKDYTGPASSCDDSCDDFESFAGCHYSSQCNENITAQLDTVPDSGMDFVFTGDSLTFQGTATDPDTYGLFRIQHWRMYISPDPSDTSFGYWGAGTDLSISPSHSSWTEVGATNSLDTGEVEIYFTEDLTSSGTPLSAGDYYVIFDVADGNGNFVFDHELAVNNPELYDDSSFIYGPISVQVDEPLSATDGYLDIIEGGTIDVNVFSFCSDPNGLPFTFYEEVENVVGGTVEFLGQSWSMGYAQFRFTHDAYTIDNVGFDFTCYVYDNDSDNDTGRLNFSVVQTFDDPITLSFDSVENAVLTLGTPTLGDPEVEGWQWPFETGDGLYINNSTNAYRLVMEEGGTAQLVLSADDEEFNNSNLFIGLTANLDSMPQKLNIVRVNSDPPYDINTTYDNWYCHDHSDWYNSSDNFCDSRIYNGGFQSEGQLIFRISVNEYEYWDYPDFNPSLHLIHIVVLPTDGTTGSSPILVDNVNQLAIDLEVVVMPVASPADAPEINITMEQGSDFVIPFGNNSWDGSQFGGGNPNELEYYTTFSGDICIDRDGETSDIYTTAGGGYWRIVNSPTYSDIAELTTSYPTYDGTLVFHYSHDDSSNFTDSIGYECCKSTNMSDVNLNPYFALYESEDMEGLGANPVGINHEGNCTDSSVTPVQLLGAGIPEQEIDHLTFQRNNPADPYLYDIDTNIELLSSYSGASWTGIVSGGYSDEGLNIEPGKTYTMSVTYSYIPASSDMEGYCEVSDDGGGTTFEVNCGNGAPNAKLSIYTNDASDWSAYSTLNLPPTGDGSCYPDCEDGEKIIQHNIGGGTEYLSPLPHMLETVHHTFVAEEGGANPGSMFRATIPYSYHANSEDAGYEIPGGALCENSGGQGCNTGCTPVQYAHPSELIIESILVREGLTTTREICGQGTINVILEEANLAPQTPDEDLLYTDDYSVEGDTMVISSATLNVDNLCNDLEGDEVYHCFSGVTDYPYSGSPCSGLDVVTTSTYAPLWGVVERTADDNYGDSVNYHNSPDTMNWGQTEDYLFYQCVDSLGQVSSPKQVNININIGLSSPTVETVTVSTQENTAVLAQLVCSDPHGDSITYGFDNYSTYPNTPNGGVISAFNEANGEVVFTPAAGYSGVESINYQCSDDTEADPGQGLLQINVSPTSQAPTPSGIPLTDGGTTTQVQIPWKIGTGDYTNPQFFGLSCSDQDTSMEFIPSFVFNIPTLMNNGISDAIAYEDGDYLYSNLLPNGYGTFPQGPLEIEITDDSNSLVEVIENTPFNVEDTAGAIFSDTTTTFDIAAQRPDWPEDWSPNIWGQYFRINPENAPQPGTYTFSYKCKEHMVEDDGITLTGDVLESSTETISVRVKAATGGPIIMPIQANEWTDGELWIHNNFANWEFQSSVGFYYDNARVQGNSNSTSGWWSDPGGINPPYGNKKWGAWGGEGDAWEFADDGSINWLKGPNLNKTDFIKMEMIHPNSDGQWEERHFARIPLLGFPLHPEYSSTGTGIDLGQGSKQVMLGQYWPGQDQGRGPFHTEVDPYAYQTAYMDQMPSLQYLNLDDHDYFEYDGLGLVGHKAYWISWATEVWNYIDTDNFEFGNPNDPDDYDAEQYGQGFDHYWTWFNRKRFIAPFFQPVWYQDDQSRDDAYSVRLTMVEDTPAYFSVRAYNPYDPEFDGTCEPYENAHVCDNVFGGADELRDEFNIETMMGWTEGGQAPTHFIPKVFQQEKFRKTAAVKIDAEVTGWAATGCDGGPCLEVELGGSEEELVQEVIGGNNSINGHRRLRGQYLFHPVDPIIINDSWYTEQDGGYDPDEGGDFVSYINNREKATRLDLRLFNVAWDLNWRNVSPRPKLNYLDYNHGYGQYDTSNGTDFTTTTWYDNPGLIPYGFSSHQYEHDFSWGSGMSIYPYFQFMSSPSGAHSDIGWNLSLGFWWNMNCTRASGELPEGDYYEAQRYNTLSSDANYWFTDGTNGSSAYEAGSPVFCPPVGSERFPLGAIMSDYECDECNQGPEVFNDPDPGSAPPSVRERVFKIVPNENFASEASYDQDITISITATRCDEIFVWDCVEEEESALGETCNGFNPGSAHAYYPNIRLFDGDCVCFHSNLGSEYCGDTSVTSFSLLVDPVEDGGQLEITNDAPSKYFPPYLHGTGIDDSYFETGMSQGENNTEFISPGQYDGIDFDPEDYSNYFYHASFTLTDIEGRNWGSNGKGPILCDDGGDSEDDPLSDEGDGNWHYPSAVNSTSGNDECIRIWDMDSLSQHGNFVSQLILRSYTSSGQTKTYQYDVHIHPRKSITSGNLRPRIEAWKKTGSTITLSYVDLIETQISTLTSGNNIETSDWRDQLNPSRYGCMNPVASNFCPTCVFPLDDCEFPNDDTYPFGHLSNTSDGISHIDFVGDTTIIQNFDEINRASLKFATYLPDRLNGSSTMWYEQLNNLQQLVTVGIKIHGNCSSRTNNIDSERFAMSLHQSHDTDIADSSSYTVMDSYWFLSEGEEQVYLGNADYYNVYEHPQLNSPYGLWPLDGGTDYQEFVIPIHLFKSNLMLGGRNFLDITYLNDGTCDEGVCNGLWDEHPNCLDGTTKLYIEAISLQIKDANGNALTDKVEITLNNADLDSHWTNFDGLNVYPVYYESRVDYYELKEQAQMENFNFPSLAGTNESPIIEQSPDATFGGTTINPKEFDSEMGSLRFDFNEVFWKTYPTGADKLKFFYQNIQKKLHVPNATTENLKYGWLDSWDQYSDVRTILYPGSGLPLNWYTGDTAYSGFYIPYELSFVYLQYYLDNVYNDDDPYTELTESIWMNFCNPWNELWLENIGLNWKLELQYLSPGVFTDYIAEYQPEHSSYQLGLHDNLTHVWPTTPNELSKFTAPEHPSESNPDQIILINNHEEFGCNNMTIFGEFDPDYFIPFDLRIDVATSTGTVADFDKIAGHYCGNGTTRCKQKVIHSEYFGATNEVYLLGSQAFEEQSEEAKYQFEWSEPEGVCFIELTLQDAEVPVDHSFGPPILYFSNDDLALTSNEWLEVGRMTSGISEFYFGDEDFGVGDPSDITWVHTTGFASGIELDSDLTYLQRTICKNGTNYIKVGAFSSDQIRIRNLRVLQSEGICSDGSSCGIIKEGPWYDCSINDGTESGCLGATSYGCLYDLSDNTCGCNTPELGCVDEENNISEMNNINHYLVSGWGTIIDNSLQEIYLLGENISKCIGYGHCNQPENIPGTDLSASTLTRAGLVSYDYKLQVDLDSSTNLGAPRDEFYTIKVRGTQTELLDFYERFTMDPDKTIAVVGTRINLTGGIYASSPQFGVCCNEIYDQNIEDNELGCVENVYTKFRLLDNGINFGTDNVYLEGNEPYAIISGKILNSPLTFCSADSPSVSDPDGINVGFGDRILVDSGRGYGSEEYESLRIVINDGVLPEHPDNYVDTGQLVYDGWTEDSEIPVIYPLSVEENAPEIKLVMEISRQFSAYQTLPEEIASWDLDPVDTGLAYQELPEIFVNLVGVNPPHINYVKYLSESKPQVGIQNSELTSYYNIGQTISDNSYIELNYDDNFGIKSIGSVNFATWIPREYPSGDPYQALATLTINGEQASNEFAAYTEVADDGSVSYIWDNLINAVNQSFYSSNYRAYLSETSDPNPNSNLKVVMIESLKVGEEYNGFIGMDIMDTHYIQKPVFTDIQYGEKYPIIHVYEDFEYFDLLITASDRDTQATMAISTSVSEAENISVEVLEDYIGYYETSTGVPYGVPIIWDSEQTDLAGYTYPYDDFISDYFGSLSPSLESYAFTSMGGTDVGGDFYHSDLSHYNSIVRISEISPVEKNYNGDVDIALRIIDNNSLIDKFIFKLIVHPINDSPTIKSTGDINMFMNNETYPNDINIPIEASDIEEPSRNIILQEAAIVNGLAGDDSDDDTWYGFIYEDEEVNGYFESGNPTYCTRIQKAVELIQSVGDAPSEIDGVQVLPDDIPDSWDISCTNTTYCRSICYQKLGMSRITAEKLCSFADYDENGKVEDLDIATCNADTGASLEAWSGVIEFKGGPPSYCGGYRGNDAGNEITSNKSLLDVVHDMLSYYGAQITLTSHGLEHTCINEYSPYLYLEFSSSTGTDSPFSSSNCINQYGIHHYLENVLGYDILENEELIYELRELICGSDSCNSTDPGDLQRIITQLQNEEIGDVDSYLPRFKTCYSGDNEGKLCNSDDDCPSYQTPNFIKENSVESFLNYTGWEHLKNYVHITPDFNSVGTAKVRLSAKDTGLNEDYTITEMRTGYSKFDVNIIGTNPEGPQGYVISEELATFGLVPDNFNFTIAGSDDRKEYPTSVTREYELASLLNYHPNTTLPYCRIGSQNVHRTIVPKDECFAGNQALLEVMPEVDIYDVEWNDGNLILANCQAVGGVLNDYGECCSSTISNIDGFNLEDYYNDNYNQNPSWYEADFRDELNLLGQYFSYPGAVVTDYCMVTINADFKYTNRTTNHNKGGYLSNNVQYNPLDYVVGYKLQIIDVVENYDNLCTPIGDTGSEVCQNVYLEQEIGVPAQNSTLYDWWGKLGLDFDNTSWSNMWNDIKREGWEEQGIGSGLNLNANKVLFTSGLLTGAHIRRLIDIGYPFKFKYPSIYVVVVEALDSYNNITKTVQPIDARNIVKLQQTVRFKFSPWQGFNITGLDEVDNTSYHIDSRDRDDRPSLGLWHYDNLIANKTEDWSVYTNEAYKGYSESGAGNFHEQVYNSRFNINAYPTSKVTDDYTKAYQGGILDVQSTPCYGWNPSTCAQDNNWHYAEQEADCIYVHPFHTCYSQDCLYPSTNVENDETAPQGVKCDYRKYPMNVAWDPTHISNQWSNNIVVKFKHNEDLGISYHEKNNDVDGDFHYFAPCSDDDDSFGFVEADSNTGTYYPDDIDELFPSDWNDKISIRVPNEDQKIDNSSYKAGNKLEHYLNLYDSDAQPSPEYACSILYGGPVEAWSVEPYNSCIGYSAPPFNDNRGTVFPGQEFESGYKCIYDASIASGYSNLTYKIIPDADVRSPISLGSSNSVLFKYYDEELHPKSYEETKAPLNVQVFFYTRKPDPVSQSSSIFDNFLVNDDSDDPQSIDSGDVFLGFLDWGDGTEMEYTDEPFQLGSGRFNNHTYHKSGIYEITGVMFLVSRDAETQEINGISTYEGFVLRINVSKDPSIEDEFKVLGGEGYDFIPYAETTPIVSGISKYSLYYKVLHTINGYLKGMDDQIDIPYKYLGEKLSSEIALSNINPNSIGEFMTSFIGKTAIDLGLSADDELIKSIEDYWVDESGNSHNVCEFNLDSDVYENSYFECTLPESTNLNQTFVLSDYADTNNRYVSAFQDCEDECVIFADVSSTKGFYDGVVDAVTGDLVADEEDYTDVDGNTKTNNITPRVINNGLKLHYGELGDYLGDSDIGQIRYFNKPLDMWEMLGFECEETSGLYLYNIISNSGFYSSESVPSLDNWTHVNACANLTDNPNPYVDDEGVLVITTTNSTNYSGVYRVDTTHGTWGDNRIPTVAGQEYTFTVRYSNERYADSGDSSVSFYIPDDHDDSGGSTWYDTRHIDLPDTSGEFVDLSVSFTAQYDNELMRIKTLYGTIFNELFTGCNDYNLDNDNYASGDDFCKDVTGWAGSVCKMDSYVQMDYMCTNNASGGRGCEGNSSYVEGNYGYNYESPQILKVDWVMLQDGLDSFEQYASHDNPIDERGDCITSESGNPSYERYWKHIIPEDYLVSDRIGVDSLPALPDLQDDQLEILFGFGYHNTDGLTLNDDTIVDEYIEIRYSQSPGEIVNTIVMEFEDLLIPPLTANSYEYSENIITNSTFDADIDFWNITNSTSLDGSTVRSSVEWDEEEQAIKLSVLELSGDCVDGTCTNDQTTCETNEHCDNFVSIDQGPTLFEFDYGVKYLLSFRAKANNSSNTIKVQDSSNGMGDLNIEGLSLPTDEYGYFGYEFNPNEHSNLIKFQRDTGVNNYHFWIDDIKLTRWTLVGEGTGYSPALGGIIENDNYLAETSSDGRKLTLTPRDFDVQLSPDSPAINELFINVPIKSRGDKFGFKNITIDGAKSLSYQTYTLHGSQLNPFNPDGLGTTLAEDVTSVYGISHENPLYNSEFNLTLPMENPDDGGYINPMPLNNLIYWTLEDTSIEDINNIFGVYDGLITGIIKIDGGIASAWTNGLGWVGSLFTLEKGQFYKFIVTEFVNVPEILGQINFEYTVRTLESEHFYIFPPWVETKFTGFSGTVIDDNSPQTWMPYCEGNREFQRRGDCVDADYKWRNPYYPILPKFNKLGFFDEEKLGLTGIPFGYSGRKWNEDDLNSSITSEKLPSNMIDKALIDISLSSIEDNYLEDLGPINNFGILIDDYKIQYTPSPTALKNTKPRIRQKIGVEEEDKPY